MKVYPTDGQDGPEPPPLSGATVRFVASHEILHNYFPFYMGIDAACYPLFDDAGPPFSSISLVWRMWAKSKRTLFSKRPDWKYRGSHFRHRYSHHYACRFYTWPGLRPVMPTKSRRWAYLALKDLLGDEAFKVLWQEFMARWYGKHPLPWDMLQYLQCHSEQDLTWFFNNWFFESHFVDLAAAGLDKTNDLASRGNRH